jgi:glycosyltransferase involved in cell wall biosynthesis
MPPVPFVSVLMPVRNESNYISVSLGAVLAQDYPAGRWEVILADGLSTDGTRQMVTDLMGRHPHLKLIDNPAGIVPTGLNAALQIAQGEIIVRVDGHTEIAPDYVWQCVNCLQRTGADNVGGKMTAIGNPPVGTAVVLATSSPFGVGGARFHYSDREEWVDTVYMGAWPRAVFDRLGGFDEELVRDQDDEFNYRLREHGGRILLCPQIKSRYAVRSTLTSLARQYFQYGFWKIRVLQKHLRQMQVRQFIPPALVAGLWVALLLTLTVPWGWVSLLAIGGPYVLATLAASVWSGRGAGWRLLLVLAVVFVILHLSYGLGFLIGLVRFWNRWGDRAGKTPTLQPVDAARV